MKKERQPKITDKRARKRQKLENGTYKERKEKPKTREKPVQEKTKKREFPDPNSENELLKLLNELHHYLYDGVLNKDIHHRPQSNDTFTEGLGRHFAIEKPSIMPV